VRNLRKGPNRRDGCAARHQEFPLRMLRAKNRDGSRLPADLWLLD